LLNTYTKLKDATRLDSFIKTESRRESSGVGSESGTDELPFDLDTAIRVCRQADTSSMLHTLLKGGLGTKTIFASRSRIPETITTP
jgi:hypothetical protein